MAKRLVALWAVMLMVAGVRVEAADPSALLRTPSRCPVSCRSIGILIVVTCTRI